MIHDAFQPISYWNGFMPSPKWDGVLLDTHIYEMFSVAVSAYLSTPTVIHVTCLDTGESDERPTTYFVSL
jgi:hypothetical protein